MNPYRDHKSHTIAKVSKKSKHSIDSFPVSVKAIVTHREVDAAKLRKGREMIESYAKYERELHQNVSHATIKILGKMYS